MTPKRYRDKYYMSEQDAGLDPKPAAHTHSGQQPGRLN